MKKKLITERKWNKLDDKATDGFYEKKNADGSKEHPYDGFKKYMNAVEDFPEYRIIGIRHQFRMLKDKWKNYNNEIHWFFQRGRKGYCDRDLWELNTWFATTFPKMLMELSEKTVSYPPGFGSSDHDEIDEDRLNSQSIPDDKDNEEFLAWKAAIRETAEKFEATGGYHFKGPTEEEKRNRDEAFEFVRKYFYDLWW